MRKLAKLCNCSLFMLLLISVLLRSNPVEASTYDAEADIAYMEHSTVPSGSSGRCNAYEVPEGDSWYLEPWPYAKTGEPVIPDDPPLAPEDGSSIHLITGTTGVQGFTSGSKYWDDLTSYSLSPESDAPTIIDIWYGSNQEFGHIGTPQQWVNILGNVSDPAGVASLVYSLNDGPSVSLSMGPDDRRLALEGDFNIDPDRTDFVNGSNEVVITATDNLSQTTVATVTVQYSDANTWPQPYIIDWSTVTNIQDVAQVVDGKWNIVADGVRPIEIGYDRMIAIGDLSWTDYEVTVPIIIHSVDMNTGPLSGTPGLGLLMRWTGHTDSPVAGWQPKSGWEPNGAIGWWRWSSPSSAVLEFYNTGESKSFLPALEVPYILKMRVESTPGQGGLYSLKAWEDGQPEPPAWDLVYQAGTSDLANGSFLLLAHHVDASFGNIIATPLDLTHTLTVATVGGGEVDVAPDQPAYTHGQVVTLTAQPDPGWTFTGWSGDLNGHYNPATLTMTSDKESSATFTESPVSDDFNCCSLNADLWTWVDPRGDATYAMTGTFTQDAWLSISVPANSDHNVWRDGNFAARVMQPLSDADFEIEVKFDSPLTQTYQMQGVLVEQDIDNVLRFEFFSQSSYTRLYAAILEPNPDPPPPLMPTVKYNQEITGTNVAPLYMRVRRQGDQWTQSYSYNGVNWTKAVTFTHALTVTAVGTYAGNAIGASSPKHTAHIDYFFNTASPIIPEDADRNTLTLGISPVGSGMVHADPDKPNYNCSEVVTLTATAYAGWTFGSWSGDLITTTNPVTVTMDASKVITATFTETEYHPVLDIAKAGPTAAQVGDLVFYNFTVRHDATSDGSPVSDVLVTDDVAGDATYLGGDDGDGDLEVGETWAYAVGYIIQPTDPDPLVNTVAVEGQDGYGAIVSDTDSHSLNVEYNAVLDIVKDGPVKVSVGDAAVYTFTVSHDAASDDSPISNVSVTDDVAGGADYASGDDNDGLLEAGESWVFTASYTVQSSNPDPLVNTATAQGQDGDGDPVSDTDSHSLDVDYVPVLQITKVGPATAELGDEVTYTFGVRHDAASDGSPVSDIYVDDDIAGPATYVTGDDGDDALEVSETWIFTASYTMQPTDPDPLVNTATAQGQDKDGDDVSDSDSHSLDVDYVPVLEIVKNGPTAAQVGDIVSYNFTVSHDAASDGSPVFSPSVTDDVAGDATYLSGDDGNDGRLEVGETWTFTATYTVQPTDPDPLVNTAAVQGLDKDGDDVSDSSSHSLNVEYNPVLDIVKDGPVKVSVGEAAVYTFIVSHDTASDGSPINNVSVYDDIAREATYVSGDDNDGLLEAGETWTFTASYTVQSTDPNPLVNIATAQGQDGDGDPVSDTDSHEMEVIPKWFIYLPIVLNRY